MIQTTGVREAAAANLAVTSDAADAIALSGAQTHLKRMPTDLHVENTSLQIGVTSILDTETGTVAFNSNKPVDVWVVQMSGDSQQAPTPSGVDSGNVGTPGLVHTRVLALIKVTNPAIFVLSAVTKKVCSVVLCHPPI